MILETGFFALFLILKLYVTNDKSDDSEVLREIQNLKKQVGNREYFNDSMRTVTDQIIESFFEKKQVIDDWTAYQMKMTMERIYKEASYFFMFYSSKVEITRDSHIEEIFFIRYPYVVDLQEYDKDLFNRDVDRSSTKLKVTQLMQNFDHFWISMQFNHFLSSKNWIVSILFTYEWIYINLSFFIVRNIHYSLSSFFDKD